MDAGERLFARRGIYGVSLREINTAAGQRNVSALHYHFGSRDGLLRAIFARHAEHIRGRRLAILDELGYPDSAIDAWSAARVMIEPLTAALESGPSGRAFAQVVPQVLTDPSRQSAALAEFVGDTGRELAVQLLAPHCAWLPDELVNARLGVLQIQVVHSIADRARAQDHPKLALPLQPLNVFVPNLIDMFVAALLGPASPATMAAMGAELGALRSTGTSAAGTRSA
jgi:AcrR family transcriptional regulator